MSSETPSSDHGQATLARGASIGRYVVLGAGRRGGMGEVYAAYDPELDRKVAVKLLRVKPGAGVSLAEGRQRMLREAQAIARLSHPNVVVVYDVGTFDEKVFIAMEFVDGNTAGYWAQSQHAHLAGGAEGVHGGRARAGGRARRGAGPPRLQARQRHGRPRRPGARHGLRARAPGQREAGGGGARRRPVAGDGACDGA